MRGFNRVIIAGNLTRDPDVRSTVNKNTFARFGVAINTQRKDANGTWQDNTEYVNVVVWGAMAETCGKYLRKGSPVLIEGRLQTSTYEAKDGSGKRTSTDVIAENVAFLSSGQQDGNSGGNYSRNSAPQQRQQQPQNNNYRQPQELMPPTDDDFGHPIGEGGFNDIPF